VSNVTLAQNARSAVVTYETTGGPGIATFLLKTGGVDVCHSEIVRTVSGDISRYVGAGTHSFTWDAGRDFPEQLVSNLTVTVTLWATNDPPTYCAVSLIEPGTALFYGSADEVPFGASHGFWKKDWLLLRKIPATGPGGVTLGSPNTEWSHLADETQRTINITRPFYMGVFSVTQRQWDLVGVRAKTSHWNNTTDWEERPVEKVSYYDIRANPAGLSSNDPAVDWPTNGHAVATNSFMGLLRAKTGGILEFDLPTEAQWEYACRAGTDGPWNNGVGSANNDDDPNMNLLGRYRNNGGKMLVGGIWYDPDLAAALGSVLAVTASNATAKVGSYLPNAWGLYDMHGNVWEWCLNYSIANAADATLSGDDPAGPVTGSNRAIRGGGREVGASYTRSARRYSYGPTARYNYLGFRVAAAAEAMY
jgi:formylglycine-generating enzyme required for sulfatase activity